MSVFKRGKKGIYSYSFQIGNHPFFGTTGCTTKEAAEKYEEIKRAEATLAIAKGTPKEGEPLNFDQALGRLWTEVCQFYTGTNRTTVETAFGWLLDKSGIGRNTLLPDINAAKITTAIARRRGEGVANSTVNRTVTELLRLLHIRARDNWEQRVKPIEWKKLMLVEPEERITSLKTHQEPKLMASMRADYLPAIRFKLKSGFRKMEVVGLLKDDIDFGNRTITVRGKGRGGKLKVATVPLSKELREIVWPLMSNPTDHVFTFTAPKTCVNPKTKQKYVRGEQYPMTYSGLGSAWRRFGPSKCGIKDFHLHDLRHTAATRLAKKANIKVVSRFLRHSDIATTAKYMAVYDEDILAAMEAETDDRVAQQNALQNPLQDSEKQA